MLWWHRNQVIVKIATWTNENVINVSGCFNLFLQLMKASQFVIEPGQCMLRSNLVIGNQLTKGRSWLISGRSAYNLGRFVVCGIVRAEVFIYGCYVKLDQCSVLIARGVGASYLVSKLPRERGYHKIKMYSDSQIAINPSNKSCCLSHLCYNLVNHIDKVHYYQRSVN